MRNFYLSALGFVVEEKLNNNIIIIFNGKI